MKKSKRLDIFNSNDDFRELVKLVSSELSYRYKRGYIRDLDAFGVLWLGLDNLLSNGKYIYKNVYRYRKDMGKGCINHIRQRCKCIDEYYKDMKKLNKEKKIRDSKIGGK